MKYILLLMLVSIGAWADESKYIPICLSLDKKCNTVDNIGYLSAGIGTLNNIKQNLYNIGYMRRIHTKGNEDMFLGLQLNGSEKDSIYGGLLSVGMGF